MEKDINQLEYENIMLRDQLATEKAKLNKLLSFIKSYENDMEFECSTILEENLKDSMNDIFKYIHKLSK